MMAQFNYDFCVKLHEKLKAKFRGKVFTIIEDDVLRIEVYMRNQSWAIAWDGISEMILRGLSTDTVARVAVRQYRKYITEQSCGAFFR